MDLKRLLFIIVAAAALLYSSVLSAQTLKLPKKVKPGDVFFAEVEELEGYTLSGLSFNDTPLDVFYLNDRPGALIGIDVGAVPGRSIITAVFRGKDGDSFNIEEKIKIAPRKFPVVNVKRKELSPKEKIRWEGEKTKKERIFNESVSYPLWTEEFVPPMSGKQVVSKDGEFGLIRRTKIGKTYHKAYHAGIDFWGEIGMPVSAANRGEIVLAEEMLLEGKVVIISHGVGMYTLYMHLNDINVKVGDFVEKGGQIGTLGNTGRSTGAHLHFEARINGARIDPRKIFNSFGGAYEKIETPAQEVVKPVSPETGANPIVSRCGPILPLVEQAKKLLENEELSVITQKKTVVTKIKTGRGKKRAVQNITKSEFVVVGKETVLVTLGQDCSLRTIRIESPLSKDQRKNKFVVWRTVPEVCTAEKISGGGVSKNFGVWCPDVKEPVLAGKHLFDKNIKILSDAQEAKTAIYSPYSDDLAVPERIEAGRTYIEEQITLARNELMRLGVRSRAVPEKLIAEVFPEWMLYRLSIIEHVDHAEVKDFGPEYTENKVLTQFGLNKEKTFIYSDSSAGALCIMQIMPGTYYGVRGNYPSAKLPRNHREGSCGEHVTAIVAAYLVLDDKLATMPRFGMPADFTEKFMQDPVTYGVYLAVSYNGGAEAAARLYKKISLPRLKEILADFFSKFKPRKKECKKTICGETWFFIKKFCDLQNGCRNEETEN